LERHSNDFKNYRNDGEKKFPKFSHNCSIWELNFKITIVQKTFNLTKKNYNIFFCRGGKIVSERQRKANQFGKQSTPSLSETACGGGNERSPIRYDHI
jgi:hypothetical protein